MTRVLFSCLVLVACSNSHHNPPGGDAGEDVEAPDSQAMDGQAPDVFDAGSLVQACPPDINPYAAPYVACSPDGATCNESSVCGSALSCECREGLWNCNFAHPDPVCTCGREPAEGDPCATVGASCGACCPTAGAPDWAPMICNAGSWQAIGCPPVLCPATMGTCPVNPREHIGEDCSVEGLACGNACCSTSTECDGETWIGGPDAECLCRPEPPCGSGTCRDDQFCVQTCGPDDGPVYSCDSLPEGCMDCSCIPLDPDRGRCEMRDGVPVIGYFCG